MERFCKSLFCLNETYSLVYVNDLRQHRVMMPDNSWHKPGRSIHENCWNCLSKDN